jgi:hypothetical protein
MDKVIGLGVSFQLLSKVGWVEVMNGNLGRRYRLGYVFSFFSPTSNELFFGWGERNVWGGKGVFLAFLRILNFLGGIGKGWGIG